MMKILSLLLLGLASTVTAGPVIPPSPFGCAYANNSLGECGCNGQIFIAHQCHSGFICLGGGDDPLITTVTGVWEGCQLECAEDEVLRADPNNGGKWDCFRTSEGSRPLTCAGKFKTECGCLPDEPEDPEDECKIGDCACDDQIWVAHDCHEAKVCREGGASWIDCRGTTTNATGTLEDTPYVNVNLLTRTWSCVQTDELCIGSFHVGCQNDPVTDPTTATTATTPTPTATTHTTTTTDPTPTDPNSGIDIDIRIDMNIVIDIDLTI